MKQSTQVVFDGKRATLLDAEQPIRLDCRPDFLIVACKQGGQLQSVARLICQAELVGPHTWIVPLVNGMPHWYFHGFAEELKLQSVDPTGAIWGALPPPQVLGAAVYISATRLSPILVNNNAFDNNVLVVGEARDGSDGSAAQAFRALFEGSAAPKIHVQIAQSIRSSVWDKLVANLSYNALSGITGAAGEQLASAPALRALGTELIAEAQAVAAALPHDPPVRFSFSPSGTIDHIAARHPPGSNKLPSMRQDIEAARPTERASIVQAIQELGALVGQPTPTVDIIHSLLEEVERNASRMRATR